MNVHVCMPVSTLISHDIRHHKYPIIIIIIIIIVAHIYFCISISAAKEIAWSCLLLGNQISLRSLISWHLVENELDYMPESLCMLEKRY